MTSTIFKFFAFLFLLLELSLNAQTIKFKGTYGGSDYDYGYSACQSYDKGYVVVGSTSSYSSSMDVYLFKTDSLGTVQWSKNIGGSNIDIGRSLRETSDSGYVIAGYTNSFGNNGYDIYLIRTNKYGDTLWTKTYGGSNWEFAYSVQQTYDGGFIICGGTYSYGAGDEDAYLIKTNSVGDTLWTKTFGGSSEDEARSVLESVQDSGIVIAGYTNSLSDSLGNGWIVKTDKNGNNGWMREYGGNQRDYLMDIKETVLFNGYVAVGGTRSYGPDEDVYMIRIKYDGDTVWTGFAKPISSSSDDEVANAVAISQYDSSFVFLGFTKSGSVGFEDVYFYKFDSAGYYIAATGYGTSGHDIGYSISPTEDKGFIICGQTDTTGTGFGFPNVFLVKTDSAGMTRLGPFITDIPETESIFTTSLHVFPNPAVYQTNLIFTCDDHSLDLKHLSVNLYDMTGKMLQPLTLSSGIQRSPSNIFISIELKNIPAGMYLIKVFDGNGVVGRSLLVVGT